MLEGLQAAGLEKLTKDARRDVTAESIFRFGQICLAMSRISSVS